MFFGLRTSENPSFSGHIVSVCYKSRTTYKTLSAGFCDALTFCDCKVRQTVHKIILLRCSLGFRLLSIVLFLFLVHYENQVFWFFQISNVASEKNAKLSLIWELMKDNQIQLFFVFWKTLLYDIFGTSFNKDCFKIAFHVTKLFIEKFPTKSNLKYFSKTHSL